MRIEYSFPFQQECHKAAQFFFGSDDIEVGDVSEGPIGDVFVLTVGCETSNDALMVMGACLAMGGTRYRR